MHKRLIAAAVVAAALGGCSAVSELPTAEEFHQAQLNAITPPTSTPAQRCYDFGAVEGTPELERCAAAVIELRKEPYYGVTMNDADYCGRVALGGSPVYRTCMAQRAEMHQSMADEWAGVVDAAYAEDARRAAAWNGVAQGMHNFNVQQQQQRNSMVTCTTPPAYGGTVTTTCR